MLFVIGLQQHGFVHYIAKFHSEQLILKTRILENVQHCTMTLHWYCQVEWFTHFWLDNTNSCLDFSPFMIAPHCTINNNIPFFCKCMVLALTSVWTDTSTLLHSPGLLHLDCLLFLRGHVGLLQLALLLLCWRHCLCYSDCHGVLITQVSNYCSVTRVWSEVV